MKNTPTTANIIPGKHCKFSWQNMLAKSAFPLAIVFSPAMASVDSENRFLRSPPQQAFMRTQVYTLQPGETVTSVANKYHISIDTLRQLNALRTFSRGFEQVQQGDELNVPLNPLPEVHWDPAPGRNNDAAYSDENLPAHKTARVAVQASTLLSDNPNGDRALDMTRGIATSAVSNEIQQWLSQFGTARVRLDSDKHFSLKNSEVDILVPVYERKNDLIFTQASLHRTNDRNQSNLGVGYRHFATSWMLGGNVFLDYDLSRDHARLGTGVEYWRDFVKLGVNSYQRLTNWKDSPDISDREERPANGWDLRLEGWLPSYPQAGGKLVYEKYYGEEVALFGKEDRQNNPYVITAGINYTPVPLITFSTEQRQGQSGKSDMRFGIDMTYRLGVAWRDQFDPSAVAAMRVLSGNRYDLVARNNNIVLEYRKIEVIHLKTIDLVNGYAGEQKSLGVSVNSKYKLDRIEWEAPSLLAAGGRITQEGENYAVILPAFQSGANAENSYIISGIAIDSRGNHSNRNTTQITVQESEIAEVSQVNGTFTPEKSSLPADGNSTQELTLTLTDENSQPVEMDVSEIIFEINTLKSAKISPLVRKSAGVYALTVTAGTDNETITVVPVVNGVKFSSAEVVTERALVTEAPEAISVNNHTFTADAGFPTTGFTGATFTLLPQHGANASDYTWTSDAASWVSVTDGVVTFTNTGTGDKVTITGTPKGGEGKIITWSFSLKSWFVGNGVTHMNWPETNAFCNNIPDYSLATMQQLNGNADLQKGTRGILGGLWSEWGNMSAYPGSNFPSVIVWSSDKYDDEKHYYAVLNNGFINTASDNLTYFAACRTNL